MMADHYHDAGIRAAKAAIAAEEKYREAKEMFDAVTQSYLENNATALSQLDRQSRAEKDPRRIKAAGDAAWHREEVNMYVNIAQLMFKLEKQEKERENLTPIR
jgi:hypothetical protein